MKDLNATVSNESISKMLKKIAHAQVKDNVSDEIQTVQDYIQQVGKKNWPIADKVNEQLTLAVTK